MSSSRVISQDNHVIEPVDLWTSRAESKYAWRVPHVEDLGEEGDYWICDGRKIIGVDGGSASVGNRFVDPDNKSSGHKIADVRPGGWLPEEHVKDLDIDGQDVSIVYPTTVFMLYGVPDGELVDSICRSYNDWVGEFCGAIPKRIKGIAMINTDDVQVGIKELERCAKMGHIGAMIAVYPSVGQLYDNPAYEPFWAAAQDLEMPLSLHIAGNRYSPVQELPIPISLGPPLHVTLPIGRRCRFPISSSAAFLSAIRNSRWARWSMSCPGLPTSWTGLTTLTPTECHRNLIQPQAARRPTRWSGSKMACFPATISATTVS